MKNKETADSQRKINKDNCSIIGDTVIGLYYLSSVAKNNSIDYLADVIDEAILKSIKIGCSSHSEAVDVEPDEDLEAAIEDACTFIDYYCGIRDPQTRAMLVKIIGEIKE